MLRKRYTRRESQLELIVLQQPSSPISEQYRMIRTNIQYALGANTVIKTIVVTSPQQGDGKTTTSSNLAIAFAKFGQKVLLIDGDMRSGRLHEIFNLSNSYGLSHELNAKEVTMNSVKKAKGIRNLDVMTSGEIISNPSELLGSKRMDTLLTIVKNQYDTVIIDTPPVLVGTDGQLVAAKVDGAVLVTRENHTLKGTIKDAKSLLEKVGTDILGIVYNGRHDKPIAKKY